MKVAVNKRVLFDLLKKSLNENRMPGGDHGGRMIHPFNVQSPNSDPFGFYEDDEDTPISVSDHMAVQLSVPKMPVEDEDFVPNTITELCNSAALICKEVPITQIEYYYRQLHILLDRALDRDDQSGLDSLDESFDISRHTTIKDFNVISESARIRKRSNDKPELQDIPAELSPEDMRGYEEAQDKDEYMRGYDFAADYEVEGKSEDELEEHQNYVDSQSQDFISGYSAGDEVASGLKNNTEDDRPLFPTRPGENKLGTGKPIFDSFQQFLARDASIDLATGNIDTTKYDNASPAEKAAMDASASLQEVFKAIHDEATALMMDPKMASEFGALLMPVTQEFGLGSQQILTPLNVGRMFQYINKMKNQTKKLEKIQEVQMKIFVIVSEAMDKVIRKKSRLRKNLQNYAAEAGKNFNEFVMELKKDISGSYTSYGGTSRFAGQGDDAVVKNAIDKLFAAFIKSIQLPGTKNKFKDRTHFYNNVNLNSQEQILDGFSAVVMSSLRDKANPELYVVRDADIILSLDEEELLGEIETFITAVFEFAEEAQRAIEPETSDIDIADESTDEVDEIQAEDYMTALEEFTARHARGKTVDFQDLAPYFGYSGSAGMRQYFLKDIQPKLEMMSFTDDEGKPSNVGALMNFNAEVLVDQMLVVINTKLIPKYEKLVAIGGNKVKKRTVNAKNKVQHVGTVEILASLKEQIIPVLETLQQLFNQGDKYTDMTSNPDHPARDLLYLVGGFVFREVNMAPVDAVFSTMRGDLNDAIADSIIARVGKGKISRSAITEKGGIAEYFTQLKTKPDYTAPPATKKGKIVKKLIGFGLTPQVFAEVLVDAEEVWQDGILDKLQDFDGAIYKDAIEDAVDDLTDNPANLMKAIESAIKATAQEKVYRDLEKQTR